MSPADLKKISELLTEMRWQLAAFTSFIPETSKEYKMFKAKGHEISRLRDLCEEAAMSSEPTK